LVVAIVVLFVVVVVVVVVNIFLLLLCSMAWLVCKGCLKGGWTWGKGGRQGGLEGKRMIMLWKKMNVIGK
jgi:hypothetical protein